MMVIDDIKYSMFWIAFIVSAIYIHSCNGASLAQPSIHHHVILDDVSIVSHSNPQAPNFVYISFSSNIAKKIESISYSKVITLQQVSLSDDSPYQPIDIPFVFNFFGRNIKTLYVNPNGALHISATQPCSSCDCFGPCGGFNNTYKGLIAGFLTDLIPFKSKRANITFMTSNDKATVYFFHVPFFYSNYNNSFSMSVYSDGRMQIQYVEVYPAIAGDLAVNPVGWLTGMRPPRRWFHTNYSASQMKTAWESWSVLYPGLYPQKSMVQSGMQFDACPISTFWCAQPNSVDISTATAPLVLRALSMSCAGLIEFGVYLTPSADLSTSSGQVSRCLQSLRNTNMLTCNLKHSPSVQLKLGSAIVYVAWRVNGTLSAFTPLNINPIPITLIGVVTDSPSLLPSSSPSPVSSVPSPSRNSCSVNSVPPNCQSSVCSLCSQDYRCLNLTCSTNSSEALYSYPTCNSTCASNLVYDSTFQRCCSRHQQDCNGYCMGTSKIAKASNGAFVCCTSQVDCKGVCGGPSKTDACGTCGGKDIEGTTCHTGVVIHTDSIGYNAMYVTVNAQPSSGFTGYGVINVTNTNSSTVAVTFSVTGSRQSNGPVVSIARWSKQTLLIAPYSSSLIHVNVSMWAIVNNKQYQWEVKKITVTFTRPAVWGFSANYPIFVYPTMKNCTLLASRNTCVRLPGCMYCLSYPGIRLLSSPSYLNSTGDSADESVASPTLYSASEEEEVDSDVEELTVKYLQYVNSQLAFGKRQFGDPCT